MTASSAVFKTMWPTLSETFEAELLATLIAERTGGLTMTPSRVPVRSDDPLERLEALLENGEGGSHA